MSVSLPGANSPLTGQAFPSFLHPPIKQLHGGAKQQEEEEDPSTTFQINYRPPPPGFTRTKLVDPVPPASVIHKNACFSCLEESLTQSTYRAAGGVPVERCSGSGHMYTTNFHMDADRRLETHRTTNQDGFLPPSVDGAVKEPQMQFRSDNPGPLGNRAHNGPVQSEYCGSFIAAAGNFKLKTESQLQESADMPTHRNTITGQYGLSRSPGWEDLVTTHCDTYRGDPLQSRNPLSSTAQLQRQRFTSIPHGDPLKAAQPPTTHHASFEPPPHGNDGHREAYNKSTAVRAIHGASIKLGDSDGAQQYFSTTATDTYRSHQSTGRALLLIRFPRNASFLPHGDLEPGRVRERMNHTTTRNTHQQPPTWGYPHHVDGSNLHTLSHIPLGSPQCTYYPTMAHSYQPVCLPMHRVHAPVSDNIPFNYYPGHLCSSTTADSYRSHAGVRVNQPNPVALENLRRSHWQLPSMGPPSYSTTNKDCFAPPPIPPPHTAHTTLHPGGP